MKSKSLKQSTVDCCDSEKDYRRKLYDDVSKVLNQRLFCTCCLRDVKNDVLIKDKVYIHPFFQVLVCKDCLKFYGNGYISPDEDGSDKYCRWCGQGGCLYVCSDCPVAICKICVRRNMNRTVRKDVEKDDWKCFSCDPKPLYELRAQAWALKSWLKSKNKPKKEVKEVPKADSNTLHGQIKNALDYELALIKEIQKLCRSCDMKLGGLSRRKDVLNIADLTFDKVTNISKEVVNHVNTTASKLMQFEKDITSYFKDLAPVIKRLEKEKTDNTSAAIEISDAEDDIPTEERNDKAQSSDKEEKNSKKHKDTKKEVIKPKKMGSASKRVVDLTDDDSNSSTKKADSNSNGVTNGDCEGNDILSETDVQSSKDTDDNTCLYETVTDEVKDKDGIVPKLTLRIRKVEEVNKVLEDHATISEGVVPTSEIINIDDDNPPLDSEPTGETIAQEVSPDSVESVKSASNPDDSNKEELNGEDSVAIETTRKDNRRSESKDKESSKKENDLKEKSSIKNDMEGSAKKPVRRKSVAEKEKNSSSKAKRKENKEPDSKALCPNQSGDIFSEEDEKVVTCVVSSTSDNSSEDGKSNSPERKQVRKSRGARNSTKKKVNSDNSSDGDSDIEKLINTNILSKKRKLEVKQESESAKKRSEEKLNRSKRSKEKTILDFDDEDSDDSAKQLTVIDDLHAELNAQIKLEPNDFDSLWKITKMDYFQSVKKRSSLSPYSSDDEKVSSASCNSEDLLLDSDDERRNKKRKKSKNNKGKENSDDSEDEKDSKSSKWKSDKLLTMKLSDDSDSDNIFRKKSDKKNDKRNKKKTINLLSDSEAEGKDEKGKSKNSSESSDSDDMTEDETPKKKRKRIKNATSSSDDDNGVEGSGGKGHRKNIRKVLKKDSLQESTQNALKEEEDRKKRISERQKLYNQMIQGDQIKSSKVDKLVLDFDIDSKEEILSVDKDLVEKLKPHQAEGIKFMWDSCYETVKKAKKNKGSGCILAHCMGLGKTLQVVTLLHTLLSNDVGVKCALVLCPLSTVLNWVNEFEKWLSTVGSGQDVDVFHMTKINAQYRANRLREWQRQGGVMILAYNLFRVLVNPTKRIKAALKNAYLETLCEPGPDLVICDEGHLLKNEKTALSKAVEKITTLRRIVLTGTPLQNNLIEYHCMMKFVKPNLLGTRKEFINRFVNPIENGQFVDSTPQDVKVMKRRAHVLHKMLDGIVQRKAYSVLVPFLPTKFEYVLSLSLTDVQVKLYEHYLENLARNKSGTGTGTSLFKDRNMLSLICAHPRLLMVHNENELLKKDFEESDEEGSLKDFIQDSTSDSSSSEESSSEDSNSSASVKMVSRRKTRSAPEEDKNDDVEEETRDDTWWSSIIQDGDMDDIGASSKLQLLFFILHKCAEIGDKLLVFSQSLLVLDLIEYFLDKIDEQSQTEELKPGLRGFSGSWSKGIDYFRLDGKTSSENRANWCNRFNSEDNLRARLFLISTRAGGLGINLTGANRVILFDASWNPSHDVQSIFRVYRFGQSKPCYIYRFLNKGTMEQKVYDRQVTKLSMSCRVIDEQQIDRHFSFADLNELYTFNPNEKDDKTPPLPKDRLLAEMLQEHKDLVLWYHSHDSLLENQENEELNEEERKLAWADFENEKNPPANDMMNNFAETYQKVYNTLKIKYPHWSDGDVRQAVNTVLSKMNTMAGVNTTAQLHQQQQFAQQQYMLMQQFRGIAPNQGQFQMQPRLQVGPPRAFNNQPFNNQVYGNKYYQGLPTMNNPVTMSNLSRMTGVNNAFPTINQNNLLTNPFALSKTLPNPFNQNAQTMLQGNLGSAQLAGTSQPPVPSTSAKQPEQ